MFPELAEDLGYLAPIRLEWVGNTISGPQDIQALVTDDVDIGGAFNGSILKMIAYGAPAVAVIGTGGSDALSSSKLCVMSNHPVRTAADLRGRTIGLNALGAQSEFSLNRYLHNGGQGDVDTAGITLVPLPPVALEGALRMGRIDAAMFPAPLQDIAMARGGLQEVFSEYDLFGDLMMNALAMRRSFVAQHPATARLFVGAMARAIEWARVTPRATVIARFKSIVRRRGRNENLMPLDYWKSTSVGQPGGVLQPTDFSIFRDWFVRNGEPRLAEVNLTQIYSNSFNPYAARTPLPSDPE
nr:ABC transporter substrate-binding protein [Gluconacetobacter johannae]